MLKLACATAPGVEELALPLIRHLIPALNHVKKEQSGQSALRVQEHKIIALDFCPRGNDRPNAYLGPLELHNVRFFGHLNTG